MGQASAVVAAGPIAWKLLHAADALRVPFHDPELGVFLSADPFVQFPESTQGFNRYAYVGNNPLSYNDPSGYFVVELMAAGAAIASWAASSWYAAMIVGATVGYVTTGSLEGALFGAVSGLTAYGVGVLPGFNDPFTDTLWRAAMHGFVQGGIASAQHGSFRSGFLSAFTSKLLGPKEGSWNDFTGEMGGRVIQSAVIGGTASVIGGGKFANGAVTAAFVQLFNDEASRQRAANAPGRQLETFAADEIVVRPEEVNDVYRGFFRQHKDIPLDQITINDQAYAQALLVEGIRAGQSVGWVGSTAEALLFRKPTSFAQIGSRLGRSLYVNRADAFGDVSLSDVQSARVSRSVAAQIALSQRSVYIHRMATGYFDDPNQSMRVP